MHVEALHLVVETWMVGSAHQLLNHSHLPFRLKAPRALSTLYASSHLTLPNPMMLILVLLHLLCLCTFGGGGVSLELQKSWMLTL